MKSRTWSLISLVCFLAAIVCWLLGNQRSTPAPPPPATHATGHTAAVGSLRAPGTTQVQLLSTLPSTGTAAAAARSVAPVAAPPPPAPAAPVDPQFPGRLRNTTKTLDQLCRTESAILLRNALIDTASPVPLDPPPHLRAGEDPGSYLVQARGPITDGFRAALAASGASIVSYIPNNAYLIQASPEAAQQLRNAPGTQALLPFEPYFKLDPALLPLAVEQELMPEDGWLNITAFPGQGEAARSALARLGAEIRGEGRTPFGPQFVIAPARDSLVAVASLREVQLVEPFASREVLNDLTRMRLGVATDPTNAANYFGLSGSNIWVNVNDTGIDAEHPDLKGRVFADGPLALTDTNGHGTHVAGTIASTGEHSPTQTNAPGSILGASFRGLAPAAKLFALPVDLITGALRSDRYLQETGARTNYTVLGRTNAMVSNNSWGYPRQFDYNTAAAGYDAAVRDALPELPGPQAMLYVFAAGNSGHGNDVGTGGEPGTITSPGTAKNVITVGAIDSPRQITYEVVSTNQVTNIVEGEFVVTNVVETNLVVMGETDSNFEVAPFSSRGNVGLGREGEAGRFKPDVVAPGAFLVSTRSKDWSVTRLFTNSLVNVNPAQVVGPGQLNAYSLFVPTNAVRLIIEAMPNNASPTPFPGLPLYVLRGTYPTTNDFINTNVVVLTTNSTPPIAGGQWYYSVGNLTAEPVSFDLRTIVEVSIGFTKLYEVLTNLNENLAPDYRYDSGTSASAAAVSGMLALIQEFFEQTLKRSYTPALLKALLINGARSLGPEYDFQVQNRINYQGWGLANLPTTLPGALTNSTDESQWPIRWVDQSPTNALATGDLHAYEVSMPPDLTDADLRVTLVWTDPPGNPAASVKLVNDLDLIVSNTVTGESFVGNFIPAGSDYTAASGTNAPPSFDTINNVENVFLRQPKGTNFTIQVLGRRVNVNAVTAHTNGIVQDYALVVSLASTNHLQFKQVTSTNTVPPPVTLVTNGVPLLQQHVGALSPLQAYSIGLSNQWHFYVFTNRFREGIDVLTNGAFVRFLTFVPPNLSVPRNDQSDIDLYVTRGDPRLLTLDPPAVAASLKSLRRGGTEWVVVTNAALDEVFYVGVKSEDQRASEYGFVTLSTQDSGEIIDENGNHILTGMPARVAVPDGSPVEPGNAFVFAFGYTPINVGRAIVSNTNLHERPGDLLGNLDHDGKFVVLNNHNDGNGTPPGAVGGVYDDSGAGDVNPSSSTDGPGSLNGFIGTEGSGPWILTEVDNSLGHTGYVEQLTIRLEPSPDLLLGVEGAVLANQFRYYFFDVPPDASRFSVVLSRLTGPANVYLRREQLPTVAAYDKAALMVPPGGVVSIGINDSPPLTAGRYYIGIFNPSAYTVSYFLQVQIERNLPASFHKDFFPTNVTDLGDDVLTIATNQVNEPRVVTDITVGLRINHQRLSDLAVYLVNPQGQRALLNENRGGPDRTQYGFDTLTTNFHHVALTYSTNTGRATLYLDGEPLSERDVGPLRLETTHDLFLGNKPRTNAPANQYLGSLDEVDLYRRALAPSEILGIYKFGGAGKPTNDLVSRWPFDGDGTDLMTNNAAQILGPTFVAGKFGRALEFAKAADLVRITNHTGLDVGAGAGFTLDAWINPKDLSEDRPLAVWTDGTNAAGVEFFIRPGSYTNVPVGELCARLVTVDRVTNLITSVQGLIRTNGVFTNLLYTTFTDNTNLAFLPIKFGNPATNTDYLATNQLVSGFEITNQVQPVLTFTNTETFDGWTVVAGPVTVLSAPPVVHTGTNLLVLRRGALTRTLPTVPGQAYRIQWVNRTQPLPADIVSWWPGERSPQDVIGTNNGALVGAVTYVPGMVGEAFGFSTNTDALSIAPHPSLDYTNELTFELWFDSPDPGDKATLFAKGNLPGAINYAAAISPAGVDLWFNDPTSTDPQSDMPDGRELMRWNTLPAPGVFHHLAATFRQSSPTQVELQLYLDGELRRSKVLRGRLADAVNTSPLAVGADFVGNLTGRFLVLDEPAVYQRALSATEIAEIYAMNAVGKRPPLRFAQTRVIVDNVSSNTFTAPAQWQTNSMTFLAGPNATRLDVQALAAGAMFDSFELVPLQATFFLPEETLKPLLGRTASGTWYLELIDRRTGATNPITPELLSWDLGLTFAPPRYPTVTLTNGVPYTNAIPLGQARYFVVEVPRSATQATNTLQSGLGLDLWFNQDALPSADALAGDFRLLTNTTFGISVIGTNGTWQTDTNGVPVTGISPAPTLKPGQRYYLAITNTGPLQPFVVRVDFDGLDTNVLGVVPLGYGQTIVTNIAVTNALHYYRYSVTTNAVAASFEVYPTGGNVNLYLRKAEPVPDPLPTPRVFDYASENPGTNAEIITVTQDSIVPLGSGDWYLGVMNVDTNVVDYRIRVIEYTNQLQGVTRLVENVPATAAVPSGSRALKYYVFTTTNDRPAVQFDLFNLSGQATLLLQQNRKPSRDDYLQLDPGFTNAPAKIILRTNEALPSLNGDWYVAVGSDEPVGAADVSFAVLASFPSDPPPVPLLTSGIPATGTLAADTFGVPRAPDYYRFVVSSGATNAVFIVTPVDGDVDVVLRRGLPLPDLTSYDYASANPDLTIESMVVTPDSAPVALSAGDWYLAVFNQTLNSATYRVQAFEEIEGVIVPPTINSVVTVSGDTVTIGWVAAPGLVFQVQYATGIPASGPIPWIAVPGVVTSATGMYAYQDDGSLTGGTTPIKLYRLLQVQP